MKKFFIIIIATFFTFCINVSAASCNNVQCVTCSYTVGNYEVIYNVTATGSGGATVTRDTKKIDASSRLVYSFIDAENAIVSDNFIQNEKLFCPATLYIEYEAGASTNVGVHLSFIKFHGSKASTSLNSSSSSDNKKPFITSDNNTGKACAYQGTMIQGSGSVYVTITREGENLNYELGNDYNVGTSDISVTDFPENQEGTCPTIYVQCGSSGNNKFCHFYKDATSIDKSQGNEGQEGQKPGSSTYDGDIGFDIGEDLDCDSIFSGRFGEFLRKIYNLIKFTVPIVIIGMSIVDFIKAIASQDQKEINKGANKLVKRLIIGVLIFVLPTLLEFILKKAGIKFGVCGIGKS